MDLGKHLAILLFVLIVYAIHGFILFGEELSITVSPPAPPSDNNPIAWMGFMLSVMAYVFTILFSVFRVIASIFTFSIYPYPINVLLALFFNSLLFYGLYPLIVMLVRALSDVIRSIGNLLPFTAILVLLALSTFTPVVADNPYIQIENDYANDQLIIQVTNVTAFGIRKVGDQLINWIAYNVTSYNYTLKDYGDYVLYYVVNNKTYSMLISHKPFYYRIVRDHIYEVMILAVFLVLSVFHWLFAFIGIADSIYFALITRNEVPVDPRLWIGLVIALYFVLSMIMYRIGRKIRI